VLVKRVLFLLNAALAIAILQLISQVHLPSFVKMLPKKNRYITQLKKGFNKTIVRMILT